MPTMKVEVPRSLQHPVTNLRVKHSQGESTTEVDVTCLARVEIDLPEGVTEDEVEIVGEYCDARGQRDERMDVVQVKTPGKSAEPPKAPEKPPKYPKVEEVVTEAPAAPAAAAAPAADAAPATDSVPATDAAPAADATATDAAPAADAVPAKAAKSKKS